MPDIDKFENMKDYLIDKDLLIQMSSPFSLEQTMLDMAKTQRKYIRWRSQAVKEKEEAELNLEIISADIVQEFVEKYVTVEGKPPPASMRSEIRKLELPRDTRYQMVRRKLIRANENYDYLTGLCYTFNTKKEMIKELRGMAKELMLPDWMVYRVGRGEKTDEETMMEEVKDDAVKLLDEYNQT